MDLFSENYEEKYMQFLSTLKVILGDVKTQVLISHCKEMFNEYIIAVIVVGLNNQHLCH